ncbi:MAG: hypothetical protein J0L92_25640 [Deltaproteobacteria bacterium]|nr:hypothetical protein [Deltaproteobacteria bacterium]
MNRLLRLTVPVALGSAALWSTLVGADGCRAANATTPAPDVEGAWAVTYGSSFDVDVEIGGAHYTATVPESGGMVHVEHGGTGFDFEVDCARPEVVCPSEVWPERVTIDQRDATYRHRMWVTIPSQSCSVALTAPDADTCGEGTTNPECDPVCDGEITTSEREAFGLIEEGGARFDLLLGGGAASNGVNCVLLGVSVAEADLVNEGSASENDWRSIAMQNGEVRTAYAGGCLWAGDPDMDGEAQALVLGASLTLTVDFTATRE